MNVLIFNVLIFSGIAIFAIYAIIIHFIMQLMIHANLIPFYYAIIDLFPLIVLV